MPPGKEFTKPMSKLKKVLVICQNYPSRENPFSQPFIHNRLKEFYKVFDLSVVSFAATESYEMDGIKVYSEKDFSKHFGMTTFDSLISHAPNIRNHYRFILRNFFNFMNILFIFHGYEVIDIQKRIYNQPTQLKFPHPYPLISKIYHKLKLPITSLFLSILKTLKKCNFIFVSQELLKEATEDLKCNLFKNEKDTFVVNNPINSIFNSTSYQPTNEFDFICIRPFDDPKYGIDIFIKLAEYNPEFSFHLHGKGTLPVFKTWPSNLKVFHKYISPMELPSILNKYRAAILPTRWDSQGVLACEIATLGMPLLTSELPVCKEMLSDLKNVIFINNNNFHEIKLSELKLVSHKTFSTIFSHERTTNKEIEISLNLIEQNG